jgi:Resolvase, N terminal domain/DDE_Tnp_1-associated
VPAGPSSPIPLGLAPLRDASPLQEAEPSHLLAYLATIPDPRSALGRRHPLVAILTLAAAAVLAGARSYAAIAEWATDAPQPVRAALGAWRDAPDQLQVDALQRAGCYRVFTETASGGRADRPTLEQVLDQLRPGDTLVVWKLDRLGRSLLVDTVIALAERGVGFRSLQEAIDTTTPGGKLVFHVFAALAEFERALIRERTAAGLATARARGRRVGRRS